MVFRKFRRGTCARTGAEMLKLLLVDDEYIVLKGLEIVLRDQKEVSLEIRTAIDAVDAYERRRLDAGCYYRGY